MRGLLTIFAAVGLALAAPAAQAEPADFAAAIANADRSEQDRALDESRQPEQVLAFLGLERGDRVLDSLTATGYYAELMARAVGPEGFVLSHNPPSLVEQFELAPVIAARGYGERLPNVAAYDYEVDDLAFEPESLDFALLNLVFHDLWYVPSPEGGPLSTDPAAFLARLYTGMKPGGIVGIVDHVGLAGSDPAEETARAHRIDPALIRLMMEQAGFVLEAESDMFRNPDDDHQLLVFDPAIRGHTDRVAYRFRKPAA